MDRQKQNGCGITGLVDRRNINGRWIAPNRVPHPGTIPYYLCQVWSFFHWRVRFRTMSHWSILLAGTILYQLSLNWEIVPSITIVSTYWYDFGPIIAVKVIYPNCWNDFRPIVAATVRIPGTISHWLSPVQTVTLTFRTAVCDFVPWLSLRHLAPMLVHDFVPIMAGMVIFPTGWDDFVPIITGVFYSLRFHTYQLSLYLGHQAFIFMFLQVTLFCAIQLPFLFCAPLIRWSTCPKSQCNPLSRVIH